MITDFPMWMRILEGKIKKQVTSFFTIVEKIIKNDNNSTEQIVESLFDLYLETESLKEYELQKEQYGYHVKCDNSVINTLSSNSDMILLRIHKIVKSMAKCDIVSVKGIVNYINQFDYIKKSHFESLSDQEISILYQKYLTDIIGSKILVDNYEINLLDGLKTVEGLIQLNRKLCDLENQSFSSLKKVMDFKLSKAPYFCNDKNASILDMSAKENNISTESIEILQSAVRDNIKTSLLARNYLFDKIDGNLLKNLRIRNAPLVIKNSTNSNSLFFSYEDGIKIIKEAFSVVSDEMSDFVSFMVENNLIEHTVNTLKSLGANATSYQNSAKISVVFMQYKCDLPSVITLAHELGHAYHHSKLMASPNYERDYPLVLAESASMFAENLVINHLSKKYSNSIEIDVIRHERIIKAFDLMIMVPSRFDFEKDIYSLREKGLLTKESIYLASKENKKDWYGRSNGIENANEWLLVRHYFMPNNSFYNYPYYFGFIFNAALLKHSSDAGFMDKFNDLLIKSGNRNVSVRDLLLNTFSFDIESADFWNESISTINDILINDINSFK